MLDKIKELAGSVQQFQANSAESLEQFRLKFLSKKGEIGQLFDEFRTVPAEMKKQLGAEINKLKQFAQQKYDDAAAALENAVSDDSRHDLTRPGEPFEIGTRHPISIRTHFLLRRNRWSPTRTTFCCAHTHRACSRA